MQLAATQPNETPPKKSLLSRVERGRVESPHRILVYGPPKVGKSTFAAAAPDPLFLDTEEGTDELDVSRVRIREWDDLLAVLDELADPLSGYRTLVLDSVTNAQRMAERVVCAKHKRETIRDFSWGKGEAAVWGLWSRAMSKAERLCTERRMSVVLIGHSAVENFKNPEGDDFSRYVPSLSKEVRAAVLQWTKAILFANFETLTSVDKDSKIAKGVGGKARYLHTEHCDAYDAGNRYNLPERIELSWQTFADAVAGGTARVDEIVAQVTASIAGLSEANRALAQKSLEACANDTRKLSQLLNWTKTKQENKQ